MVFVEEQKITKPLALLLVRGLLFYTLLLWSLILNALVAGNGFKIVMNFIFFLAEIVYCWDNPCSNGGTCDQFSGSCFCHYDYRGNLCESMWNIFRSSCFFSVLSK